MISEWVLSLAGGFVEWLASLFGDWEPPAELTGAVEGVNGLLATFASLGVWVNWAVLSSCVAVSVSTFLIVLGIQVARAIGSHVPAFGGAGA